MCDFQVENAKLFPEADTQGMRVEDALRNAGVVVFDLRGDGERDRAKSVAVVSKGLHTLRELALR